MINKQLNSSRQNFIYIYLNLKTNDAENVALKKKINYIIKYIWKETVISNCHNISQYYCSTVQPW